jgi:hypothetical protein
MKKTLENMREKIRVKSQIKNSILLRIASFISRENLALDKFKKLCLLIEDVINLIVPGETQFTLVEETLISWYGCFKFISALNNTVLDRENNELKFAKKLSIMIDESTDITQDKKLIVYSQFINRTNYEVSSIYLGLIELTGLDSETIFNNLIAFLKQRGINIQKIASMASDGASVMRGKETGVISRLKKLIGGNIVDVHCTSHCLALMMTKATKENVFMRNFDEVLRDLYYYYRRFHNRSELERIQKDSDITIRRLKQYKEIRWFSRYEVVETVYVNLCAILKHLLSKTQMESGKDDSASMGISNEAKKSEHSQRYLKRNEQLAREEADALLKRVKTPEFIFTLHILYDLLKDVNKVTNYLQNRSLKIFDIEPHITSLRSKITTAYIETNTYGVEFKKLVSDEAYMSQLSTFLDLNSFIESSDLSEVKQSTTKMCELMLHYFDKYFPANMIWRSLQIFNTVKLFNICVDGIDKIKNRVIINSKIEVYGDEDLNILIEHQWGKAERETGTYGSLREDVMLEWRNFKHVVCNEFFIAKLPAEKIFKSMMANISYCNAFINVLELFELSLIVPPGSVECERGFSRMKLIKTQLRNRLSKRTTNNIQYIMI